MLRYHVSFYLSPTPSPAFVFQSVHSTLLTMRSRSRTHSIIATLTQLTKRRTTTPVPVPVSPAPLQPSAQNTSNANNNNRRLHISFPHLFRMYPWQRSVYSDSTQELVDKHSEDVSLDLDAFVWDSADEKSPIVQVGPRVHDLVSAHMQRSIVLWLD